ncbi:hypothetical protein PGT21_016006 [Puccinia graminis f. sp. tritici]|uniref:Uncharacterized protein n=1 Tax=Puccinia graminis f. sp. tritici TaxID=56615 RepID=A0A5B0M764_PUCGR|nr:hypothetical protein PGT21_016006 [Puccinia graminis f. sp. tritici]
MYLHHPEFPFEDDNSQHTPSLASTAPRHHLITQSADPDLELVEKLLPRELPAIGQNHRLPTTQFPRVHHGHHFDHSNTAPVQKQTNDAPVQYQTMCLKILNLILTIYQANELLNKEFYSPD